MKRRTPNIFGLAFLDCITCGLGAIILLFVIINAKSAARQETAVASLRAETEMVERQLLMEMKNLVMLRNSLAKIQEELVEARGRSSRIIETLKAKKVALADGDKDTLAVRSHVNRLKADLISLEEEARRLRAGAKTADDMGRRLKSFPGQGDRHYLTDLKMGGKRILILVDASASMLDQTVLGVIRRRNQGRAQKLRAPKWRQVVATADWLTSQLPAASRFQIYVFNETATPLIEGTAGRWLDAGNVDQLNRAAGRMHALTPGKGTSLLAALRTVSRLRPSPDNIFLLVDGLPTMGAGKPLRRRVSSAKRLRLFKEAVRSLPAGIPVNVILYPMEGDPLAADAYWRLAKSTHGSFFSPASDWP